jgi:hypothetical protein
MRLMSAALMLTLAACQPSPATETAADAGPADADAAAPDATAEPAPPEPPLAGGYAPASLDDERVKAAQAKAIDAIYTREPQRAIVEKVEAEQQVVAGMNYRFTITMSGGARYGVTVFHSLQDTLEVTDFGKLP